MGGDGAVVFAVKWGRGEGGGGGWGFAEEEEEEDEGGGRWVEAMVGGRNEVVEWVG